MNEDRTPWRSDVKDVSIAKNELDDVTIAFSADDKVPPAVDGMQNRSVLKVVFFTEPMDPSTVGNKAYWMYDSEPLGKDDKVEMADNNKAVVITFNADDWNDGGLKTLKLARSKDAAGNWMQKFETTITIETLGKCNLSILI